MTRSRRAHRQGTAAAIVAAALAALTFPAPAAAAPAYVSQWGAFGTGAGQFNVPRGLATDAAGNVYVADSQNHRIQKFAADGSFITSWGSQGSAPGLFQSPWGLAIDGNTIYVADRNNNRIQKFDLNGNFVGEWGAIGQSGGQFNNPNGVALDGQGNVFVADEDNRRVQKFTSNGGFLFAWGRDVDSGGGTGAEVCRTATACKIGASGTGDGEFTLPVDLATDCANDVYVVDEGAASGPVQKFDSNAAFLTRWGGTTGSGDGQFNQAQGVDVARATGTVLIADRVNRRFQRFSLAGGFIDKWGSLGTGNGQFTSPYDVAVGTGGIYTSDASLHRIQRFTEGGGACGSAPTTPTTAPTGGITGLPPPVLGRTVNVSVVRGRVRIALPPRAGQRRRFVRLTAARQIPVRSFLDTRKGSVRLQSARNAAGATQSGNFSAGLFQVLQSRKRSARGLTDLVLKGGNFRRCRFPTRRSRAGAALSRRAVRRLRSRAKGRFRSRGRHAAATVRGTNWTMTDRCDGTLTKVTSGRVAVRDLRRRRTVIVRAGRSYLARALR